MVFFFAILNIHNLEPFHQSHGGWRQQISTVNEFQIRVQFFNLFPRLKTRVDKRIKLNEKQFFYSLVLKVSELGKVKAKILRLPKSKVLTLKFLFHFTVFLINVILQLLNFSLVNQQGFCCFLLLVFVACCFGMLYVYC